MRVRLVVVGKLKEKYWKDAVLEYQKRLSRYLQLEIIEVKEQPDTGDAAQQKEKEGQAILQKCEGHVVLTDIFGTLFSSEEFANKLNTVAMSGTSTFTLVIGGSRGVSDAVKQKANTTFSFGRLTYPHQMMRVMVLEQLYRAATILEGTAYHK